jgi:DNA-binding LytR/AlgR family response regulator
MTTPPLRILIVEDELLVAADLQDTLERQGYEVPMAVRSGEVALRVLSEVQPDLVLLDINLKGELSGIATAARIRAWRPVPFIFLTGQADRATLDQALAQGPAAYLVKPFVERDLSIAVELALRNARPAPAPPAPELRAPELAEGEVVADGIFLRQQGRYVKVLFTDILFIEAQGNYCLLVTPTTKYMLTTLLGSLLSRLSRPSLLRVHRSFALNLIHLSAYDELKAVVGGHEVPIGTSYRALLLRHLPTL